MVGYPSAVLRIRDVLSRITDPNFSIPDPGSKRFRIRTKNFSIYTQKNFLPNSPNMIRYVHPGSGSRIWILIFYPSRIPDPGVKQAPHPGSGSGSATLPICIRTSLLGSETGSYTSCVILICSDQDCGPVFIYGSGSSFPKQF
jgi:hypothetical protein